MAGEKDRAPPHAVSQSPHGDSERHVRRAGTDEKQWEVLRRQGASFGQAQVDEPVANRNQAKEAGNQQAPGATRAETGRIAGARSGAGRLVACICLPSAVLRSGTASASTTTPSRANAILKTKTAR